MSRPRTVAVNGSRNSMIQQGLPRLARLAFLWAAILFPLSVYGQTYNAELDFSIITPQLLTNTWTYGTKPNSNLGSGTYTLYSNVLDFLTGIKYWSHTTSFDVPFMSKNVTDTIIHQGTADWFPGQIVAHAADSTASVLRFTAPVANTFDIAASFRNQSLDYKDTKVYIYHGATQQFNGTLGNFGSSVSNTFQVTMAAGDYLEFMVGPRVDDSFNSTCTGMDVQISVAAVPEPASLALIGLSVVAGSGVFWYRRRQQLRQAQQSVDLS